MLDLFEELSKAFEDVSTYAQDLTKKARGYIAVNVSEDEVGYTVEAALPGVKKEDVVINYQDSKLIIEVKEHEVESRDYIIHERFENYSKREIKLEEVDQDKISAKFENGVLTINLPLIKKDSKTIIIE